MNGVSTLYIRKFGRKLRQYNKPMQLPEYFRRMLGARHSVRIAEVGAGPVCTIGKEWLDSSDVGYTTRNIEVVASDVLAKEYEKLWEQHGEKPIIPVEYQDIEHLSYPDESFDIVHCVNALDHTKDAKRALSELERICMKGGWVYLRHSSNQKQRFGGHHYWNIGTTLDKKMVFINGREEDYFEVSKYALSEEYDKEPHDDFKTIITAVWQKI